MLRSRSLAVLAVSLWLAGLPPAQAQEALTTREMEALSPRAATRKVQQDMLSLLQPVGQIDSGVSRRLRSVGMVTRPVGTEFSGVCRRDAVSVLYAPTQTGFSYEDAPLRPHGVEASTWFHIIRLPQPTSSAYGDDLLVWQRACDRLDQDANWFGAPDAFRAVQGAMVLEAAIAAVRSGRVKPQPCAAGARSQTCEQALAELDAIATLDSVAICEAEAGVLCYRMEADGHLAIRIRAKGTRNELPPGEILSVGVEQFIVVT